MVSSKISNNFGEVSSKGIILYFSPFINSIIAADNFAVGDSILRGRRDRTKSLRKVGADVDRRWLI